MRAMLSLSESVALAVAALAAGAFFFFSASSFFSFSAYHSGASPSFLPPFRQQFSIVWPVRPQFEFEHFGLEVDFPFPLPFGLDFADADIAASTVFSLSFRAWLESANM